MGADPRWEDVIEGYVDSIAALRLAEEAVQASWRRELNVERKAALESDWNAIEQMVDRHTVALRQAVQRHRTMEVVWAKESLASEPTGPVMALMATNGNGRRRAQRVAAGA